MTSSANFCTARLRVRRLASIDPQLFRRYLVENRDAHRPWEPTRNDDYYSLESIEKRFEAMGFDHENLPERRFALLSSDECDVIGVINFTSIASFPFHACHLGFSVGKEHEGLGLMREGLQVVIPFMFETCELNRVMANFIPRNFRSARLLQGLGFRVEGFAKNYLCINGKWEDHILTSVLRTDWFPT